MMVSMKLVGMDDVADNVDMLSTNVRDKVLKRALRKAALPIVNEAKARCPEDTGTLKESISLSISSKGHKGNWVRAFIGPKTGVKVPVGLVSRGVGKGMLRILIPTRYAHLVEFGHEVVINGEHVGHVPARAFMRGAWDSQGGETALNVFEIECAKGVDEEIAKLPDSAFIK